MDDEQYEQFPYRIPASPVGGVPWPEDRQAEVFGKFTGLLGVPDAGKDHG